MDSTTPSQSSTEVREEESPGAAAAEETAPLNRNRTSEALDCSVCSICMDYLMDAVQTSCSHKFCKFCIDRWISVNPSRRCPICRSAIGTIQSLPELDTNISSLLENSMAPEELLQRHGVRTQRARVTATREQMEQEDSDHYFDVNSWLSDTVESHLVSNALRNSLYAAQQELQHRNAHYFHPGSSRSETSDNPWATQSTSSIINRLRQSIERLHEFQGPFVPPHAHHFHELQENFNYAENVVPVVENTLLFSNDGEVHQDSRSFTTGRIPMPPRSPDNPQLRQQAHMRTMIEDNLVNEYNYHIRRVESAHSRIQEAQRDFDVHNQQLMVIYEKFVDNLNGRLNDVEQMEVNNESVENLHIRGTRRPRHPRRNSIDRSLRNTDSSDVSSLGRLRRANTRWSMNEHSDEQSPILREMSGLRQRIQNNRRHRLNSASTVRVIPSNFSMDTSEETERSQMGQTGQNLRITREEVHLPPEESSVSANTQQGRITRPGSYRSILSTNTFHSPLRTLSESTRRRYPHLDALIANSRQRGRHSVQFRTLNNIDNTPDHEFSTSTIQADSNNRLSLNPVASVRSSSSRPLPLAVVRPMERSNGHGSGFSNGVEAILTEIQNDNQYNTDVNNNSEAVTSEQQIIVKNNVH